MPNSRTIVIIIALIIVGFSAISLRNYFSQKPVETAAPEISLPRMLVAKRNLTSGAFIQTAQDLDWQAAPEFKTDAEKEKYLLEDTVKIDSLNGAVVRRGVRAGEPISPTDLMKSGDGGFLSAVLGEGKRAVSIAVNIISGNAGFISPGDKVDLLLTHHIQDGGKDEVVTETLAHDVRVLAVDQALNNPENKAILAKTVTVEVTAEQAEQISVAAELGKISISLVSAAISEDANSENAGAKTVKITNKNATLSGISKVRVIRGDKIETLEFYQDNSKDIAK